MGTLIVLGSPSETKRSPGWSREYWTSLGTVSIGRAVIHGMWRRLNLVENGEALFEPDALTAAE
jgi:hypothetical protein